MVKVVGIFDKTRIGTLPRRARRPLLRLNTYIDLRFWGPSLHTKRSRNTALAYAQIRVDVTQLFGVYEVMYLIIIQCSLCPADFEYELGHLF